MASPLTPDRLLAALKAEGVNVTEPSGWRTHNRNSKGAWSDLNGIVIHHTAGSNSLALCWTGTAALPGPLCHTHLSKAGVATMVGYGRANHAGTFAQNAFDAMRNESSTHPRPDAAEPVDANGRTYGIEIENLGDNKDPYPTVQYDAAVRWAAALCRAHGWSADSVIGHREGTRRKIDPTFSMEVFRGAVAERLKHSAGWNPNDPEEDDVALTDAQIKQIAKEVLTLDGVIDNPNPLTAPDNPFISLETSVRNIETVARRTEATLTAQVAALSAALAVLAAGGGLDAGEIQAAAEAGAQAALDRLGDALQS